MVVCGPGCGEDVEVLLEVAALGSGSDMDVATPNPRGCCCGDAHTLLDVALPGPGAGTVLLDVGPSGCGNAARFEMNSTLESLSLSSMTICDLFLDSIGIGSNPYIQSDPGHGGESIASSSY